MIDNKTVAVVSGGLDSVVLAYYLRKSLHDDLHILTFDYGQRHRKEMTYAYMCGVDLDVKVSAIDLTSVGKLLVGSSLTDETVPVPDGHYAEPSMASTIVPSRNAIMLAIAFSVAAAEKAGLVCIGVHAGDHFIYPDCRPEFIHAFDKMEEFANGGYFKRPVVFAPFLKKSKADIVALGDILKVPFEKTWSCYKGGELHCGVCGTCTERKEAFVLAGVKDPTEYQS
jgi:7-cyano-7-deazaguanine synthase